MRAPTTNPVTQGKHGNYNAIDYSYLPDSYIYAPEAGQITFYANAGDCGNNLQLTAGNRVHGFCHLQNALVTVGQKVTKGQKIGIMGYTGYTIPKGPAGRHLHWIIRVDNSYIYPPSLVTEPFGGNQSKPSAPAQGGNQVFNTEAEVQEAYLLLRGVKGTSAEAKSWIGLPKQRFFVVGKPEADAGRRERDALKQQLADVNKALANEKAKPPKEVIKIVEKIVEKPVPTGGVDADMKAEISAIRAGVDWIKALLTKVFKG